MDIQGKNTFCLRGCPGEPADQSQRQARWRGATTERRRQVGPPSLLFETALWERGYTRIAGIDEAGRGPLAGPVVASAVVFPPGISLPGVRDSKALSARKRERLYTDIMREATAVGIGCVDEREIDRINILAATYKAMRIAIDELSLPPEYLLVDGREIPDCPIGQRAFIRGDARCFSIAAASIIAKVFRDRIMMAFDRQFPEYGFAQHKGYGTAAHRAALEKHGPCALHRRSFTWKRSG